MKKSCLFLVAALVVVSCHSPYVLYGSDAKKNTNINADFAADALLEAKIMPYKKKLDSQMSAKVAFTPVELNKSGNCNLGNLLADYTFSGGNAWLEKNKHLPLDAAILNAGGIRSILAKGEITLSNVFEIMPFENELVIVKLSGEQLQQMFVYYQKHKIYNPFSGIELKIKDGQIKTALIGGKPVDTKRFYTIATSDYLALGGDNMNFFRDGEIFSTGIKLRDLFLQKMREQKDIVAPNQMRYQNEDK